MELLFFKLRGKKGWGEDRGKSKILPEKGEDLRSYFPWSKRGERGRVESWKAITHPLS